MLQKEITLTSISIIIKQTAISMVLMVVVAPHGLVQSRSLGQSKQHTLEQDVKRLGSLGNDDVADVKRLARFPAASSGLLVAQLHMVPYPQRTIVGNGSPEFEHVIWSFLALRYITGGMDFCASTKWKPGHTYEDGIRSYWLHFEDKDCVTFFAVWPSRSRYYVAPLDAQRQIISAWQRWYGEEGKQFEYKPLVNPESWQWTEGVQKLVKIGESSAK